ncbi:MMPL family transporter [Streptomyces hirsutus]|uniref:MMPL family transporter n=1 Tax=Streptomyces hirsutus TaxID=35620 RepID=UPI00363B4A4F
MATLLYRLGAFSARRWRTMLIGWLLTLAAVVGLGLTLAGSFADSGSIPGSPAQTALIKMDRHFPEPDQQSAQIVFQAPPGQKVTDAAPRTAVADALEAMGRIFGVSEVENPAESGTVSKDGRTAVAEVTFATKEADDVPDGTLDAVRAAGDGAEQAGLKAVYGGIDLRDVTWRLEMIPAADFIGMPTGASDAGCIESFAENPVHWVKVRPPEAGRHWEEHGTWLRPPILIDRRLLDPSDSGLQVLEGRTRVGVLRGRLREGLHVASHHQAWVGHP